MRATARHVGRPRTEAQEAAAGGAEDVAELNLLVLARGRAGVDTASGGACGPGHGDTRRRRPGPRRASAPNVPPARGRPSTGTMRTWRAARGSRAGDDPGPKCPRPAHTLAVSVTSSLPPLVCAGLGRHRVTSLPPALRPPDCLPAARRQWRTRACRRDPTTCRVRRAGDNSGYQATYPTKYT